MKYTILKEFYPGSNIWVLKLNDNDPEYIYDTEDQAQEKCDELSQEDPSRRYKVSTQI